MIIMMGYRGDFSLIRNGSCHAELLTIRLTRVAISLLLLLSFLLLPLLLLNRIAILFILLLLLSLLLIHFV